MGLFKSVTNAITKPIASVGAKIQQNVIDPVRQAPQKLSEKAGTELINPILQYPKKAIGNIGETIGGGAGNILSGVAPGVNDLAPALGDLIAAYVDPQAYLNRKEPFPTTTGFIDQPVVESRPIVSGMSNINWNWIIAGIAGLAGIIFIFTKKKR